MLDLVLGFLLPIPITDVSYSYTGYRWAPADAPIQMNACEGTATVVRGLAQNSTFNYGTGFTILGQQPARRVRLRFTFTDEHWQPLSTTVVTIDGNFSPGVKILRTHHYGGDFSTHGVLHGAAALLCSPLEITFADQTHWTWNPPASPYTLPPNQATPGRIPSTSHLSKSRPTVDYE